MIIFVAYVSIILIVYFVDENNINKKRSMLSSIARVKAFIIKATNPN